MKEAQWESFPSSHLALFKSRHQINLQTGTLFLLLFLLFLSKMIQLSGEQGEWKKSVCVCVCVWDSGSESHFVWPGAGPLKSVKLCQIILTAGLVLFSLIPTLHDSWKIKEKCYYRGCYRGNYHSSPEGCIWYIPLVLTARTIENWAAASRLWPCTISKKMLLFFHFRK